MSPQNKAFASIACLALVLCSLGLFGQTSTWYFGDRAGLDFSQNSPQPISGPIDTDEGSAVVTAPNGKVLFSTDGTYLFNETGHVVDSSLQGHSSSTHSAIIVPHPNNPCGRFFVFTVGSADTLSYRRGLHVTEVVARDGNVEVRGTKRLANDVAEKLAATPDGNGGYWVVVHDYDTAATPRPGHGVSFHAYHITHTSSFNSLIPKTSTAGSWHGGVSSYSGNYINTVGQMKFSKDGRFLALAVYEEQLVELFGFDIENGDVYRLVTLDRFDQIVPGVSIYGVEFSPQGNALYVTTGFVLPGDTSYLWGFELDVLNPTDIWNSRKVIDKVAATSHSHYPFGGLQLGPDDKIYVARREHNFVSVVERPGELSEPGYQDTAINLGAVCKLSLPTAINTEHCKVGASPCAGFSFELNQDTTICEGDSVLIGVEPLEGTSYRWNTGAKASKIWGHAGESYFLRMTNDSSDCRGEDTINVNLPPEIREEMLPRDTAFCMGHGTDLMFKEDGFGITWDNSVRKPSYTVEEGGLIPYRVYNQCDTVEYALEAEVEDCTCKFELPDAFTPNGDGLNDYFEIKTPCDLERYRLSIYDRWGKKVFESDDPSHHWDGKQNSANATAGVYVFSLSYKARFDEERQIKSYLTLVR